MISVKKAFDALKSEIERVTIGDSESPFAFLKAGSNEWTNLGKPKLLAKFDSYVMAHRDKSLYLPEILAPRVFRPAGQVEASILIDGRICGTWRAERAGKKLTVRLEPFTKLNANVLKQLKKEAEGVRIALGAESADCLSSTSAMA